MTFNINPVTVWKLVYRHQDGCLCQSSSVVVVLQTLLVVVQVQKNVWIKIRPESFEKDKTLNNKCKKCPLALERKGVIYYCCDYNAPLTPSVLQSV